MLDEFLLFVPVGTVSAKHGSQSTDIANMNVMTVSLVQIQDTMARMACCEGWDRDQVARLAVGARQITLDKKEKLFDKGDRVQAVYIVVSGQIRLFIPLPNGTERVLSLVERGESFGEPCVLRAEPCPYEAVAGKSSHLIAIDAMVYRRELRQSPALMEQVLDLVSLRLLRTLRDIEICAQPSSLQRVAHYLLHLRPIGVEVNGEIRLPALKRDIAAKLGLSQETFSRVLAFMAQQGFIQLSGNLLGVSDWNLLHTLARAGCPMELGGKIDPDQLESTVHAVALCDSQEPC